MEFTKEDIYNIRHRFNSAFSHCLKNKYNGRILVEPWARFVEMARAFGGRPEMKAHHKAEYWDDPANFSNEANNKNPIIKVTETFEIVRKNERPKPVRKQKTTAQVASQCDIIYTKDNDEMQPRRTTVDRQPKKPIQPYYYRVNISWIERDDTPKDVIQRVLHYLEVTGLEPVKIHNFNNGHEIEKTAEFKMQGNEGEFLWVKRGVMGLLECLVGGIPEFNIAISGKKYEDFEIDKNT